MPSNSPTEVRPVAPLVVQRLTDVVEPWVIGLMQQGYGQIAESGSAVVQLDDDGTELRYVTSNGRAPHEKWVGLCDYVRSHFDGERRCRQCDLAKFRELAESSNGNRPVSYRCHLGLVDFATPIRVAGKVVAALYHGQRRLKGGDAEVERRLEALHAEIPELDLNRMRALLQELPVTDADELEAARTLFVEVAESLGKLGTDRFEVEQRLREQTALSRVRGCFSGNYETAGELWDAAGQALGVLREACELAGAELFTNAFGTGESLYRVASHGRPLALPERLLLTSPEVALREADGAYRACADESLRRTFRELAPFQQRAADCCFALHPLGDGKLAAVFVRKAWEEPAHGNDHDRRLRLVTREVIDSIRPRKLALALEEARKTQERYVELVTHELHAALGAIESECEWLQFYTQQEQSIHAVPEVVDPLDKIVDEVTKLKSRLRGNLLLLGLGNEELRFTPRRLAPLVEECLSTHTGLARSRGIELRVGEGVDRFPAFQFDRETLLVLLMNLVDNAVKYSHAGKYIELRIRRDNEYAVIEVEDFGMGIAPEEQTLIFDRFYRAKIRDQRRFIWGGGLGLAVVKRVADLHRGRVWVECTRGAGHSPAGHSPNEDNLEGFKTVFCVKLPLEHNTETR